MRGRFIILILMFISLCACGSKVDDSQFNEQPVSQQTEMHFSTVQKVEEYFEDNSAEFVNWIFRTAFVTHYITQIRMPYNLRQ